MKTSFAAALAFAAAVALGWPERSAAYDFFYDQNCAQCHGPTRTCAGCHAHGAHGLANKQDMNVAATANKASFTPGEEVVVTVTAGYRCGWVRMLLLDGQMTTLVESSGAGGLGNGPDACTTGGITLRAPAPAAPGRYTWYAAWYGNTYDLDDRTTGAVAAFGANFRGGPGVNHGRELVPFTVTVVAGGAPAAALAPASLAFPRVKVGATAPLSARIQNTGTAVLEVTGITRCDEVAAAPFSWSLATPLSIAPGGEATLPVTYQPTAAASSTSCLRLATSDPANPALKLGVTGSADPAPAGVPGVALSASTLSFGTGVLAGTYATRTFDVQSVGTANLDVTGIAPCDGTSAGMFTFTSPLPGTIAPAEARTVTVSYTPTAAGTHSGCLTVATSAGPIDVRLSGAATMPAVTCTSCHGGTDGATGAPPTDTHGETATSRRGVGAHTAHLNTQMSPTTARQSADCSACHEAVPSFTSPLHRDGSTDVPFGGVAKANGMNPSWNPQTPTCGTVWCHGATLAEGTNTAPTWTSVGTGEAACGRCHGVPPVTNHPTVAGGLTACVSCHPETMTAAGTLDPAGKHINGTVETAGCTSCHGSSANPAPPADTKGASATTSVSVGAHQQHVTANAIAAPLACTECHGAASGTYTSGHANGLVEVSFGALSNTGVTSSWNRAAATCATYCHGGASTLQGGAATAPIWTKVDGTQASCGSCHGFPPPAPHSQSTACESCHPATVKPGGAIDVAGGKHLDGVVQYDTSKMTCSSCHGTPGRSGADPLIAAAPPNGTNGETATTTRAVGAHLAHLQPGTLSKAYACTDCHNPPTAMDHANKVVEMSFSVLAKGTGTPVFDGTTCASTYCHGNFTNGNTANAPTWTGGAAQVGCTSCHGSPPGGTHPANTACGNCHPGSSATSVDPVTHADGHIDILLTCTSCHGTTGVNAAPPRDTKGQTATTLVSVGAHQAHAATTLRAPIACTECHGAAVASYTNAHPNSTVEMAFGALSNSLGGATVWNRTAATCASNACHGGVAALKGGTATTPVWTRVDGTQKTCASCHGNPPPASSGHVQRADCGSCHPGYTNASVNLATHLNGAVDYPPQTCTSCHGSASLVAMAGADLNVNAAPPIDTRNNTAATAPGVGVHQVHVNGARSKPVACAECHAGAVPPSTQPIHANGTTTVAFGALSKTGGVAPAYTTPALTCASTYCHGNFTGGAGAAATPAWTAAGTLGCASCHGNPPALPHPQDAACADCHGAGYSTTTVNAATHVDGLVTLPTAAHPAGSCAACHGDATKTVIAAADANAKAAPPIGTRGETATTTKAVGVHTAHLNQTTYRATPIACAECHAVPLAGDKLHANGAAAIAFGTLSKTGGVTPSYNTTSLTCASTYCHGNFKNGNTGAAPSWTAAGSITCASCHGSPPSGTHPAGTACGDCHTGYTATTVNAAIHLNGVLDPPTGMTCASCHGDVTRGAVAGGDTVDNLRSGPPKDAKGNSAVTARGVGVHQVHVAGSRSKPQLCSECHVVPTSMTHSDGVSQVALSRSGTYDATALTCASTYCHGNFTGGAGAAATPAWTAAGTLNCASCHGNPPALPHPQDTACADCHGAGYSTTTVNAATHVDGLVTLPTAAHPAGSCAACHGDATKTVIAVADANAKAAPPIGTRGETATTTKAVGAHAAHLNQATFRPAPVSCGECHAVPAAGDKAHGNNALSMPFGTLARTGGAAATYNATTLSCATVYCHGGAGGTVSVQAGAASTPSWTGTFTPGASSLTCGSCHPALPTANGHPQRTDCGTCHAGASATAYSAANHLNGVIDVIPLTCATCHGNASVVAVAGADPLVQGAPPLDTKGNGGTTAVGVGVHQAHVNTARAKPVACAACHAGAVPAPTAMQHANGVVTVAFGGLSTTGGVVPSYQPAGGSCAATYCHGNFTGGVGSVATPAWISAGTLGCTSCHGDPPTANGHPQDTACADCHGAGYSTTTVNAATHVDGAVTLPTSQHPAGSCQACHGDATRVVLATADANARAAPPISAKGETTTAQRGVGAHAAHLNQATFRGTPVACAECHAAVPANDRTHANGTAAVVFGPAATYRGALPAWNAASLSCSSVYCHGNFTLGNGNGAGGGTATAPTAAPTGLAFSAVAANALGLSWAAVTGATSYKVERAPNNAGAPGTFVQVGTASATSYADAGLAASTTYWYRVRATNGAGDGPYSASVSQATTAAGTGSVAAPTAAPTGVAFSAVAANSLTVGWSAVAGATAYRIERAPNNAGAAGTFVQVGTAAGTSYADAGLTASTTYWYRVRATNDGGDGPYSANGSQATAAASTGTGTGTATRYDLAPATATSVGLDGSTTVTAQATYDYNTTTPPTTFRALGVAGYTQSSTQGRLRASTALSASTTYSVVNLYTPALTASNASVAANMPVSIDYYVRTGASNSTATIRAVLYEYNGTTGNVGSAKGSYTSPSINTSSSTSTFTTLTGTIPNAAFTVAAGNRLKVVFQVVTGSTGGNDVAILFGATRSGTNGQTFITPTLGGSSGTTPTAPGAAPTTLAFTNVAQTTLSLGWSAVTGATHYKVERAPNVSGAPGTFAQVGTTATTSYGDAGLAANTTSWYRVRAWNAGGDGPYSANAAQTTTAPAVTTPPTLAPAALAFGSVAPTTLSLSWAAVSGATHYKVERAPDVSGAPGTFAQVGTTATASYGDAGLAASTRYWYRVRAWNAGGDGPYSANASQTTPAVAPPTGGISWTGTFTPGTSSLNCQSCHGMPPAGTHPTLAAGANCGGCHTGYNAVAGATSGSVNPTLHLNATTDPPPGGEPTAATTNCGACHGAILDAMNGTTAKASKHTLGSDASADAAVSWTGTNLAAVATTGRSCTTMCHADHPHGTTTHNANVYADATTQTTRAAAKLATDFDATQASGGLCTSCHQKPVDAASPAQKPAVAKADYQGKAHDFVQNVVGTTTNTWQYTLHDSVGAFQRNCTKCHASQTEGQTPTIASNGSGNVGPHASDFGQLLAGNTNPGTAPASFVCYNCHGDNTTGKNLSGKVLVTDAAKAQGHGGFMNSSATHDRVREATATYGSGAYSGTNRHANCADCHDEHRAGKTKHTPGPNDGAITAASPLYGASGVGYTGTLPANWAAIPSTNLARVATATAEYQVCFKCHTGWAFGTTPPTGPSTLAETDLAQEFNVNNKSVHPVVNTLAAQTGSSAKGLVASQLLAPWSTSPGAQTMTCSDCHNSDAASTAAQGPHGSAVRFMLSGTNKAWPYTVAGATSGTVFRVATSETGIGTVNGLFCRNCHPQMSSTGSNSLHRNSNITGGQHGSSASVAACTGCHIRIPHGGKVSRLLVTTPAPARYKVGTANFAQITKGASKDSYSTSSWPSGFRSSCSEHSSGTGNETW